MLTEELKNEIRLLIKEELEYFKEDIINAAVERALLATPEVIGNLMANHAALHKINTEFYKAHPEFAGRKDIVQSVIEMIEGKNPTIKYEEILVKAVPEIQRRLIIAQDVNTTSIPSKIERDFGLVDLSQNGKL